MSSYYNEVKALREELKFIKKQINRLKYNIYDISSTYQKYPIVVYVTKAQQEQINRFYMRQQIVEQRLQFLLG